MARGRACALSATMYYLRRENIPTIRYSPTMTKIAIEEGELIPGTSRPIGQGVSGARRCLVRIAGTPEKCVIKRETIGGVVAECFAAEIGRHLQLPTLQPIVVRERGKSGWWFGARDQTHPSLLTTWGEGAQNQPLNIRNAALLLAAWLQVGTAISFDELIGNPDRNIGNLLWDGSDFWLIDHANAFGIKRFLHNKLAAIIAGLDQPTINGVSASAIAQAVVQQSSCGPNARIWSDLAVAFQGLAALKASAASVSTAEDVCLQFIRNQLPSLASAVANRFSPLLQAHATTNDKS
jgi:hypothetical protein